MLVTGSEEAKEKIESFITKTREKSARRGQTLSVELFQIGFGANDKEPIQSFELQPDEEDLGPLCTDIVDHAMHEAEGVGPGYERISFTVMVAGERSQKTFSLKLAEEDSEGDDNPWNTPAPVASQKGAMGMFMLHTQVLVKELRGQSSETNRMLQRENVELRRENAELRRERVKFYGLWEEMQQHRHERDMELKKVENEIRIKGMLGDKIGSAIVPLVNGLAGRKILSAPEGEAETPLESAVVDLIGSMNDDQLTQLSGSPLFNEDQKIKIMGMVQVVRSAVDTRKKAESAAAPTGLNGIGIPSDDTN